MKVLHVVAGMDPKTGGVAQAVKSMIEGLKGSGIQNEVISMDHPGEKFVEENGFTIHALGPAKTAWRYSSSLLPWLKKSIGSYDAVIIHGLWQYHCYAVLKALRQQKKQRPKLFVMPHGMLDPYFQKARDRRLKAMRNQLFWQFIERHVIGEADCLLFTCEMEKNLAAQSFSNYLPKSEEVVGLGLPVPPSFTSPMHDAFKEKCLGRDVENCLLFISRINSKKGVDLLVAAYNKYEEQHGNLPKLIIAGPDLESPFGKEVQELANRNKNIIFTGMLDGEAKWGAFYSCSAMILPSHQENFGFVVVEALACGKPVLISNQVNIWKEVEAQQAGLISRCS